jgi:hypothetical protein
VQQEDRHLTKVRRLGIGLICLWLGGIGLVIGRPASSSVLVIDEVPAEGRVVRLEDVGRRGKVPIVRYEVDGRSYEVSGDPHWRRPGGYSVRESITVYYKRGFPDVASIELWWGRWLPALLFGGGGVRFC